MRSFTILRLARGLRGGGLIAHGTSTVPGVAALPSQPQAVRKMQGFKQRRGPFLLLAGSVHMACRQMRYIPVGLRKVIPRCWPGNITLIVPGRPGLPDACYSKGHIALRVDDAAECRQLAQRSNGLIISSSLNRRGREVQRPGRRLRLRWHRYLRDAMPAAMPAARPSRLMIWQAGHLRSLR